MSRVINMVNNKLSHIPALTIWGIEKTPVPYTIAFGGVPTGKRKTQLAASVMGIAICSGFSPIPIATAPKTGRKDAAVAELLTRFVKRSLIDVVFNCLVAIVSFQFIHMGFDY